MLGVFKIKIGISWYMLDYSLYCSRLGIPGIYCRLKYCTVNRPSGSIVHSNDNSQRNYVDRKRDNCKLGKILKATQFQLSLGKALE